MNSFGVQKPSSANDPHGSATFDGSKRPQISGGRFDFEDGGTFCGGWEEGKAHGHGVCTGPKHQGAYAGAWNYGFEVSGAYIWPSGSHYEGQWQNGRRHGLGVEQIGRQIYRGEWSKDGHKGRYGIRESTVSTARYEGTWNMGYQDGYGCETYADGGKYQGQWQEGKRHGYGIRTSAPFGLASHYRRKDIHTSLNSLRSSDIGEVDKGRSEEIRGGFVLTARSDKLPARRNSLTEKSKKGFLSGFKMRKQKSTGDLEKRGTLTSSSVRSTASTSSWASTGSEQSNLTTRSAHTDSNASFTMDDEQLDSAVTETYMGEWKKDKRCGHGVAERSDGLKYEGEWYNNKKHGYGVTTFRDGTFEEGKYKNNILMTSQKKKHLFLARSRKFRDRITIAVNSAQRALKMAMQRSDIAISRTSTASDRAQNADIAADQARIDCELAVSMAREFAPDFKPSVLERFQKLFSRNHTKLNPLSGNTPSLPYDGNLRVPQKSGYAMKELNEPDLNVPLRQQSDIPSNSVLAQKKVTPQTDFANLVNQPSQSGNNSFPQMYLSQIKYNENQSKQYQENIQQQGNSPAPYRQRIGENDITVGQNKNIINVSNYISNANTDQLDGYMYNNSGHRSSIVANNSKTNYNEQQKSHQQNLTQTFNQPLANQSSQFYQMSPQQTEISGESRKPTRPPPLNEINQQLSIDYFDHYKRPPSRDSSTDRYPRTASRISSRQPSIDRSIPLQSRDMPSPNKEIRPREGSYNRESAPRSINNNFSNQIPNAAEKRPSLNQPFEDVLLHQRTLGQDIIPSPITPKRTESLYTPAKVIIPKGAPVNSYNYTGNKPIKFRDIVVTSKRLF
ncbi:junctophilin-1 isoform X2 [Zeugodacus cucurbitae]|uniref:junctophilin-1 isoform X2 n=1 Tax=Zeugodacus cucurbitae TaxID=28588 RepID=UPI0023D95D4C|nr:junctophilin-1 isoform X2 [Zeugodacus cucurbitae]